MEYLFDAWDSVAARIAGERLMLFLDFDGTLAPIAPTPDEAKLPPKTRALLERLASSTGCTVAVISGRELRDLERKIGIAGVVYVGNQGMEVRGGELVPGCTVAPADRGMLERLREALGRRLEEIAGVLIEDKGSALAVHYRLARADYAPSVEAAVREALRDCEVESDVAVTRGKKVLEIRPRTACDKGTIVSFLLARERARSGDRPVIPLYVGDDLTDEDAFERLAADGITVLVGKRARSRARYYVTTTDEVTRLLELVVERCGEKR